MSWRGKGYFTCAMQTMWSLAYLVFEFVAKSETVIKYLRKLGLDAKVEPLRVGEFDLHLGLNVLIERKTKAVKIEFPFRRVIKR